MALAPPRAARRLRSAVGLPERDGLLVRARSCRAAPPTAPASSAATCSCAPAGRPLGSVDDLFDALDAAGGGRWTLGVVRGSEERDVAVALG